MSRTPLTITTLTPNGVTLDPAGTTADATNGHVITALVPIGEFLIRCKNTDASDHDATVVAVTGHDLSTTVPANGSRYFGPLTSARYLQADGTVHLDLEAGFTGTVSVLHVPRTA